MPQESHSHQEFEETEAEKRQEEARVFRLKQLQEQPGWKDYLDLIDFEIGFSNNRLLNSTNSEEDTHLKLFIKALERCKRMLSEHLENVEAYNKIKKAGLHPKGSPMPFFSHDIEKGGNN